MSSIISHEGQGFQIWDISQMRTDGQQSTSGKHKPNVGDMVVDRMNGMYFVDSVDQNTGVPVLSHWDPANFFHSDADPDLPSSLSTSRRRQQHWAYFDQTVSPGQLTVDTHMYLYGIESTYVKVFRGRDTTATGTVISRLYNSSGAFVSENIQLERVFPANNAIKRPPQIAIDVALQEGEVVTMVEYSTTGGPVRETEMVVRLGSAIVPGNMGTKVATSISLISPLISQNNPNLILNQLDVPFDTTLLKAKIHYNDGSTSADLPIDGTKFQLMGAENHQESLLGEPSTLTLIYHPDSDEHAINLTNGPAPVLVKNYQLANQAGTTQFAVKLFVVPHWQDVNLGYELKYYLLNDEQDLLEDVTQHVTTRLLNGNPWDPMNYESVQQLYATLRMNDTSLGIYPNYIHTQAYNLTLYQPSVGQEARYLIDYKRDGTEQLGYMVKASWDDINRIIHFRNDEVNVADWLEALYDPCLPIYDPTLLSAPQTPTHFRVNLGTWEDTFSVQDNWSDLFTVPPGDTVDQYSTARITWIYQASPSDAVKYLGVTPLPVIFGS